MTQTSISAQRVVYDHVQSCGGIMNVPLSKEVIVAAQSGRMKYTHYLEERKKERNESEASRKRKLVLDQIHELGKKCTRIENDIESLLMDWQKQLGKKEISLI